MNEPFADAATPDSKASGKRPINRARHRSIFTRKD